MSLRSSQKRISVAIFCGGRGSEALIREFSRHPDVDLSLLVNAYDDGLSTGALRELVPGMLGPSDFRKNLSYLTHPFSVQGHAVSQFLELRMPAGTRTRDLEGFFSEGSIQFGSWSRLWKRFDTRLQREFSELLRICIRRLDEKHPELDLGDFAVGNLLFVGAYLLRQNSFNGASRHLSEILQCRTKLLNVTHGENLTLVALKEDGEILSRESQIVNAQSASKIFELYLMREPVFERDWAGLSMDQKRAYLSKKHVAPALSEEAERALQKADIILYGSGTQHSSIFPSFLTQDIDRIIRGSSAHLKLQILNLADDHDTKGWTPLDHTKAILFYLGQGLVTHALVDASQASSDLGTAYRELGIRLESAEIAHPLKPSVHSGFSTVAKILDLFESSQLSSDVRSRVEVHLDFECREITLPSVLAEFNEIPWNQKTQGCSLKLYVSPKSQVPSIVSGSKIQFITDRPFCEAAILDEWLAAPGSEYLVTLSGDGEYRFKNILSGIEQLASSHFSAVFGSRTQSKAQVRRSLHSVYRSSKALQILSRWSGIIASLVLSILYRVQLTDPFSGFKIFSASRILARVEPAQQSLFRSALNNSALILLFSRLGLELCEVPISYHSYEGFAPPSNRVSKGVRNLLSLVTTYFKSIFRRGA